MPDGNIEDDPEPDPELTTEERFRRLREELSAMQLPDLPGEVEQPIGIPELPPIPDFDEIRSKGWDAKRQFDTKRTEKAKQQKISQSESVSLGLGLSVAYTIIGTPLFGAAVGWALNKYTGSQSFVGIGVVVGAVLGVLVGMLMVQRHQSREK